MKQKSNRKRKARVIAFYLPQYHPIPENDLWWGKGFTEWTNVGRAKPLFRGHYQPRVPADLGYYDLRLPEVREIQAELACEAGIEGFCYWHYWFGNGRRILERPFDEVLTFGKPNFPFCLGWANESWTNKSWEAGTRKIKKTVLLEQTYSEEDYKNHFMALLPAFKDKRYITVDGKPLFYVFKPKDIPDAALYMNLWQELAKANGLDGIYFVGMARSMDWLDDSNNCIAAFLKRKKLTAEAGKKYRELLDMGFDALNSWGFIRAEYCVETAFDILLRRFMKVCFHFDKPAVFKQSEINKFAFVPEDKWDNVYPSIVPNWDRSPRSGRNARIYTGSTPELFREQIIQALDLLNGRDFEHKILFLKSWNEWGEGNYVEPDLKYGHAYLDVLKESICG